MSDNSADLTTQVTSDLAAEKRASALGDTLFPKCSEIYDSEYLKTQGIEILTNVGDSKIVPYSEFLTEAKIKTRYFRRYYLNDAPIPSLDYEDPNREMLRILVSIPRETVSKGAKFLFGKERFFGSHSFVFGTTNKSFQQGFEDFWRDSEMDVKMKRIARTNLWGGKCFLKLSSDSVTEYSIQQPSEESVSSPSVKEKVKSVKIRATYSDPEYWDCRTSKDNPNDVLAWVYQFQRPDGTFYREEIFKDVTYIYEGNLSREMKVTSQPTMIQISGSGFKEVSVSQNTEKIVYVLTKIVPYPDFDDFPVVPFYNESDSDNDGTSVYQGLTGKFDALNDLFTRMFYAFQNQATPLLWMSGVKQGTGNDVHASDAIWVLEDKDAALHVLQWDGTPKAVFEFYNELKDLIYKSIGVPKSSDLKAFTNVSGDALNAINTDIVDTTNDRRLDYEASFRILVKLVRKMLKQAKEIEKDTVIIWGPVFPESKDKLGETVTTLARERIIHRETAVKLHPYIPEHLKEELMKDAAELEKQDDIRKEEAIAAQTSRVTQRAAGTTPERGKGKNGKS